MDWLEKLAGLMADNNQGVHWVTPAGFPVVLENRKPKTRRIIAGFSKLTMYEPDPQGKLNKTEQLKVAPQFIHSMDAAHLMLTIVKLRREGLKNFQVIHDSYGVHACDVDQLNRILREEFVKVYSEDVLLRFLQEQCRRNPEVIRMGPPPPQGNLNIREILRSDYFFA